ncbi:hypothetical protein [Pseudodesulfovibrio sp.]|uniref:hypothetical protein n=1 Tax=unclassified Pseudodesulfovibrio TaxID=2661612 RepID=UPI003B00A2DE
MSKSKRKAGLGRAFQPLLSGILTAFPEGKLRMGKHNCLRNSLSKGFEPELVKGYWYDENEYHCWLRFYWKLADITFEKMDEGSELIFKSETLPQYAKYGIYENSVNEYDKIKDCFKPSSYDLKATVDFVLSKMENPQITTNHFGSSKSNGPKPPSWRLPTGRRW